MYYKSLLATFLLFFQVCFSQSDNEKRVCATSLADKRLKNIYPGYKNIIEKENEFHRQISQFRNSRFETDTIFIPIIVHVIHNGDAIGTNENISQAQVNSQIEVLNEDFQRKEGTLGYNSNSVGTSMPIKFVPALIDEEGNLLSEPGIHRFNGGKSSWDDISLIDDSLKPMTQFDPTQYLNIWVVTFGGTLSNHLGYAQFPDLSSLSGIDTYNAIASSDGLVIKFNAFGRVGNVKSPYNKGRTLTHELGHFLGLLHIWGNYDENIDCTEDDGCEDTPQTTGPIYNCPSTAPSCTSGVNAMKENYLDYTGDACMNTFTIDQKARIMTVLANSPRRKELTSSQVYITTLTGIDENTLEENRINIYPIPFENKIKIESKNQIFEAILFNIHGTAQVLDIQYYKDSNSIELPTSEISKGVYFLKLRTRSGWIVKKVLK